MQLEDALIAAIHDRPEDDTNWLVLADWLEDEGQAERAQIMRLQRRLRGLDDGEERRSLESQIHKLLLAGVSPCVPSFVNALGMRFALIPAGKFWLGSPDDEEGRYSDESPRRLIELTRPFYMSIYPVTQQAYETLMGRNPSAFSPRGRLSEFVPGMDTSMHPVEQVSWRDAMSFCRRLSRLPDEAAAKRKYRLPTEAEWEYACRGGAALCYPFPLGATISPALANYRPVVRDRTSPRHTTPVNQFLPNGFGLYDMVGNTWEWCFDWYHDRAYELNPTSDPPGPAEGERRNARGGTYNLETRRVRSADRSSFDPTHRDSDLGFRVLCPWPAV